MEDIMIESLASTGYFSKKSLLTLRSKNIETLNQLFSVNGMKEFNKLFRSSVCYDEIKGTLNLLRCACFNEDPKIDLESKVIDRKLYSALGLSTVTLNSMPSSQELKAEGFTTVRNFFEYIQSVASTDNVDSFLNELALKTSIVLNYYSQKREYIPLNEEDKEELESLRMVAEEEEKEAQKAEFLENQTRKMNSRIKKANERKKIALRNLQILLEEQETLQKESDYLDDEIAYLSLKVDTEEVTFDK